MRNSLGLAALALCAMIGSSQAQTTMIIRAAKYADARTHDYTKVTIATTTALTVAAT
jgi:hypothetical protein